MAKLYTKNTWVDETLADVERYDIAEDDGTPYKADMQITLATAVAVAGSPVNAARMNNLEDGLDAVDTRLSDLVAGTGDALPAGAIASDAITNAKLANMATQTFKGRNTAETGDPEDLSVAQVKTLLNLSGTNTGNETTETLFGTLDTSTAITSLDDTQRFPIIDGIIDDDMKKITWANVKTAIITAFGALVDGLTTKATPVDGDEIPLTDSAASNATKKLTWANLKATLKTYFDTLYPLLAASNTWNTANADVDQIFNGDNRETLRVDASRDTVNIARLNVVAGAALTISAGVITVTHSRHAVLNEGGAATDDVDTINGGADGDILIVYQSSNTQDITWKDGTGNLRLAGDFAGTNADDVLMLVNIGGTLWRELSRSDNS